ncbi:MAG: hotdog fold thioesterase [Kiritimatiellales bacterium]|nr:hotdog fold thioesterase [Kiritimatiellales bacterium]
MNELADHLKNDRFSDAIGIERVFCKDGYWTTRLTVAEIHLNGLGVAQGGALFTLADYAFAIASNSDGRTSTGLQTTMAFISPAQLGDTVIAHIREISRRKTISMYEIELRNEQTDQLIALFTGTGFRVK